MKILMLTSVYPCPTDSNENVTKVVKYFVNDWVKLGHEVRVIHNVHRYPALIHRLPKKLKNFIASKIGFYIPDMDSVREFSFDDSGAAVHRLPIFKVIPHGGHSEGVLSKQVKKICKILEADGFEPDIIMGHWMNPQIHLISRLKEIYKCRTALVLHGHDHLEKGKEDYKKHLKSIDALGCRSRTEADYIKDFFELEQKPFVCYSGIPDSFVSNYDFNGDKFDTVNNGWRFIYVGRIVEYKQIDKVIDALSQFKDKNFTLDIIGEGSASAELKAQVNRLGLNDKIIFHGRIPRNQVLEYMQKSHGFVMISKGEVFGLVYLEAMAASCITIGSKGEGIDGVINDGENGFLSTPADTADLVATLEKIFAMSPEELKAYAKKGFETACEFTDSNVAKWYIRDAYGSDAK